MKAYILETPFADQSNAAAKAPQDAYQIAVQTGFLPFRFIGARTAKRGVFSGIKATLYSIYNWMRLCLIVERGALVLVQYPHYPIKSMLIAMFAIKIAKKKNIRFIALIHDLNSLRGIAGNAGRISDSKFLPMFSAWICHNDRMKHWMTERGYPAQYIVTLGLFDYLAQESSLPERFFTPTVTVAGNLSHEKSGYIYKLQSHLPSCIKIHLYGPNYCSSLKNVSVFYHGIKPSDELPNDMHGSFGIIWDGNELDSCKGPTGKYLMINNPHKLSLYMAAGMPVVIWRNAALASFVSQYNIGITVDSLQELGNTIEGISMEQYAQMARNARGIGEKVRQGVYLRSALRTICDKFA